MDRKEQEAMDGSPAEVNITGQDVAEVFAHIKFQCGPVLEVGENGTTIEAIIQVLAHRLQGFQQGPFACSENDEAIYHLKGALTMLTFRTALRKEQGVEGTNKPHTS